MYWLASGTIQRGWALVEHGRGEEGIAQMRQGLADFRATQASNMVPYFLALLAESYGTLGQLKNWLQVSEGLTLLDEALALVNKTEERFYEAELYRLKGELSLQSRQVKTSPKSPTPRLKPKRAFRKPLLRLAGSKRSHWNSVRS